MKKALGTFIIISPLIALLVAAIVIKGIEALIGFGGAILVVAAIFATTFIGMKLRGDI